LLKTSSEPNCSLCTDDRKDKPKVGMEIIRGAVKAASEDIWEGGTIIDPENGKVYKLRLTPSFLCCIRPADPGPDDAGRLVAQH